MDEIIGSSNQLRECFPVGSVGVDTAPHQLIRKCMQEGFKFNILLVGETGIGKSTLASSLFNVHLPPSSAIHTHPEVTLESHRYKLSEKGVKLKLTITETVGYGDQINRSDSVFPISKYIDSLFEKYFKEELKIKRLLTSHADERIHVCLYFICPTGHSLKELDVMCMKQLGEKVNLIPVVARADSLSKEELLKFKLSIKNRILAHGIQIYSFPTDDEQFADFNAKSNELVPFAIAASADYVPAGDKLKRARMFPWGTMQIEDENHCDFLALKRALIDANMEDMREKTNEHYEVYRRTRMSQLGYNDSGPENKPVAFHEFIEEKRKELRKEMLRKEEELKEKFLAKTRAKELEFKNQENALRSKYKELFTKIKEEEKELQHKSKEHEEKIAKLRKKKEKYNVTY